MSIEAKSYNVRTKFEVTFVVAHDGRFETEDYRIDDTFVGTLSEVLAAAGDGRWLAAIAPKKLKKARLDVIEIAVDTDYLCPDSEEEERGMCDVVVAYPSAHGGRVEWEWSDHARSHMGKAYPSFSATKGCTKMPRVSTGYL